MNGIKANIGGKEYTLRFTMQAWERLEDEVCLVDDLGDKLAGKGRIKAIMQVFAILADCDLEEIRKTALPVHMRWGLIAGVSYTEMQTLLPGYVCDLFILHRQYDFALRGQEIH